MRFATIACVGMLPLAAESQTDPELLGAGFLAGFVDDSDQSVTRNTLRRPLRLLVFGYTSCPDVCPLTLAAAHRALAELGTRANDLDVAFVTVDPDRDSPARLHTYVSAFDARIHGYSSSLRRLRGLTDALQVQYWQERTGPGPTDYSVSHTSTLFLINRDGHVLARVPHYNDPEVLSKAIQSAVEAATR